MELIDGILNKITMYRLTVYVLRVLVGTAVMLAFLGLLPFSPFSLLFSTIFLLCVSWVTNKILAKFFGVFANLESFEITSYILALIIQPPTDVNGVIFLFWVAILAVMSKFMVVIGKKHIFNPAAFAVVVSSLTISQSASWWIGDQSMLPFVLAGGFLIVRKLRRFDLFFSFLVVVLAFAIILGLLKGTNPLVILRTIIIDSPLVFFATVMLVEPLTTPPSHIMRFFYGVIVAIGTVSFPPELALLIGNIFSYAVSPKTKLTLLLKEKIQLTHDQWDFIYVPDRKLNFIPGQYMEWTLPPEKMDVRGNRRYFTMASAPTEENVRLGIKFYEHSSSFKEKLLSMNIGETIVASQLSGEFVLNCDPNRKYVFLAGGIGITPFRSIIKYLLGINQKRDYILIYGDKTESEFIYRDVFDQSGNKIVYVPSEKVGHINEDLIRAEVPDFMDRYFYISGSHEFVRALEAEVKKIGVPRHQIKTDFFPGFV